jgi:hypothetical protein
MEELLIKPGRHNNEFATVQNTPFKEHEREKFRIRQQEET